MATMENMEAYLIKNALVPAEDKLILNFDGLKKSMEQVPVIKSLIEDNSKTKEKKQ